MGKRKGGNGDKSGRKKAKIVGFIDPGTSGVYATCNRGREQQCRKELMALFGEKIHEYFDLDQVDEGEDDDTTELSIEDLIKKELNELKEAQESKKEFLKPIELGCECLVFIKTRKPIDPEVLVSRICQESADSGVKLTRYTQRLTPISFSVTATKEELAKLATRVLKPHFHREEGQESLKFAIQVTKRNFNAIPKDEIIKKIAETVGREHGHRVDLKNYDRLIMVEGYKSNIGMSVMSNYDVLGKFNLQMIYDNAVEEKERKEKEEKGESKEEEPKEDNKDKET